MTGSMEHPAGTTPATIQLMLLVQVTLSEHATWPAARAAENA